MVISDLNIISIQQKKAIRFTGTESKIKFYNRNKKYPKVIYKDSWSILQALRGGWYQIIPMERSKGNYKFEFFDLVADQTGYKIIILNEDVKFELLNFIEILLAESPINTICVLVRLQGEENGIEFINKSEFINLIERGLLYFNKAYFIKTDE